MTENPLPSPTYATATVPVDYSMEMGLKGSIPCPFCKTNIEIDEGADEVGWPEECPSCHKPIEITVAADAEVDITCSARLSDADRQYLEWKAARDAGEKAEAV